MKIRMKKFSPEDFGDYFLLVSNEKVMEMITGRALTRTESKEKFEALLENNQIHPAFGSFKILDSRTHEFIGFCKITVDSKTAHEAELGYMLLPKFWGKGIAQEVTKRLIAIAGAQTSILSLFAIIDPANGASRKILLKNNFRSQEFKDFDGLPGEVLRLELQ